jgi:light-regulated signal transduction histidine kinase (bacteriophytochrome)
MIGASRDISKLKESEIQLKTLNNQLEARAKELVASNQELEQFAYVASHDLQEPLRMVSNFLTQIEKKYNDILDEKGKTYIHFAVDGAKRMRLMILDLLEFSRAGRNVDRPEEVDLNVLVKDILNMYQKQIEETKAIVNISDLPTLAIPKTGIRQVFQNLISNSLKYNQLKKGVIPQVSISTKHFETDWQFEVKDNGIGIDSQYFEKIFIIFQRLHDRSEYSGTGIGLAITKKIIENFGGTIWIESEIGKGTSFFFTIPKEVIPFT